MEKKMDRLKIKGMSCQHCVGSVKNALESIPGLSQVTVNLDAEEATFENDNVVREDIRAAISKIGFEPGE
jgi:copper chaperone CopZ